MDNIAAEVSGVSKVIGKKPLVQNITFQLRKGHVVALCGGNGAGKSTVLRMLAGVTQPTVGEITVHHVHWRKDRRRYARHIGYMPDDYQFNQSLTAGEVMSFWAELRQVPQARVTEVLKLVGLADKRGLLVNTFSKGMKQRVLFAQAILAKPPLLIMDEPTNGLDPYWMRELTTLLHDLKQEGHTVLFSTHQLDLAGEAADDIIFMNGGGIVGEGTTASIKEKYGSVQDAFNSSLGL
ncbi:ABC transporter ATP-binding protein [Paenibacillus tuaregi]|uniref:ABC transporter ATP-binding protein n=1 Tax=Paenibacillus tuaregi TaxID=1816681 RepID=UPI00083903F6|nr:ABC transporter ATP-binding protein [Paenibacillus tuaregi]